MAAVSQIVPNLLGGVSQQPDPIKLPGQVREAVNAYLDPTFGCKKRPPTLFIGKLADDIPTTAHWFNIFRDNQEKYAVCLYKDPNTSLFRCRVWSTLDGSEKTVTLDDNVTDYLDTDNVDDFKTLSLADYTLIANSSRVVTLSGVEDEEEDRSALIMINAVAYNTNYSIDLSKDGENEQPVKKYRARALEVSPGSWSSNDGGSCTAQDAQEFQVDGTGADAGKVGLAFRLVNQCSAYLSGTGASATYVSRYRTDVVLRNGGEGWRKGDQVTVTMGGRQYTVTVTKDSYSYAYASDGTATYVTPANTDAGVLTVDDVVTGLAEGINGTPDSGWTPDTGAGETEDDRPNIGGIDNYEAEIVGNVVKVTRTDDRDFNIGTRGGVTNRAMTSIKNTAQDIAELPDQCWDGFRVKVNNTESSDSDDYYVIFEADTAGIPGKGSWNETTAPNLANTINSSTMPHALIRQADGSFILKPLDDSDAFGGWASREVGDETTNPAPSFVDKTISNMFFYQNRLGFLSDDAVIMSQPGDYFNFWISSAIAISGADPIDMTAASTRPALLKHAQGTGKGLLLFAEHAQFLLTSQEVVFGPETVRMNEISDYNVRSKASPQSTGVSIAFSTEADTYTKVFEMAIDSVDNRPQSAEITRVVPEYIPSGMEWSTTSPNNSILLWGDLSDTVYVFKFFNQGNERQIAGWAKWQLPANVRLWGFDGDTSYIICHDGTNYTLLQMELLDNPNDSPISVSDVSGLDIKFTPRLDYITFSKDLTTSDNGDGTYKINFPVGAYPGNNAQPVLMITDGQAESAFQRPAIQGDATNGYYVDVDDFSATQEFILGIEYRMEVQLPAFYVLSEKKADRVDNPVVEFVYLDLYKSGRYSVEIDKFGWDPYTIDLDVSQADVYQAGDPRMSETTTKSLPVFSLGRLVYASVYADDPLPAAITSYSWQGHYNKRGITTLPG